MEESTIILGFFLDSQEISRQKEARLFKYIHFDREQTLNADLKKL